nr:tetratricopeptide repeat protein [FCB group bacterium]
MITLPAIFKPSTEFSSRIDTQIQGNTQWVEFVAHIAQFRDLNPPETRDQLNLLLTNEGDPTRQAVLTAGIGRCYIHEGYFLKGAQTLGYAFSLLPESNKDERAFILLEMVAFLAINGQHDLSLLLLERIPQLTSIEYLLKLADYYCAVHQTRSGSLEDVQGLLNSVKYFEKINLHSTVAYHYKNIGNVYRKYTEYERAQDYYQRGLELCRTFDYPHIESAILHDVGMLYFRQGDFKTGMLKMDQALKIADNHYTRAFIHTNRGFIQFKQDQPEPASRDFQRSLNIIVQHGIHHMIPGVAYYLAECHRRLDHIELAGYFYQKAYESAFELLKQHFPFAGDRLLAVQGYNQYLVRQQQTT